MHILCPYLKGGLGNQLFMIASSYAMAKKMDRVLAIHSKYKEENVFKHSSINYFETVFKNILQPRILDDDDDIEFITDYLQDSKIFDEYADDVRNLFHIPQIPNVHLLNACFVHFRKTDFLDIDIHHVLNENTDYYINCMNHVKLLYPETLFFILSDDVEKTFQDHAMLLNIYSDCLHPDSNKPWNELETLSIMKSCGIGGIAANSTFSWWGLYLNVDRPMLMIPNAFFNRFDMNHDGYYFKESLIKYI